MKGRETDTHREIFTMSLLVHSPDPTPPLATKALCSQELGQVEVKSPKLNPSLSFWVTKTQVVKPMPAVSPRAHQQEARAKAR